MIPESQRVYGRTKRARDALKRWRQSASGMASIKLSASKRAECRAQIAKMVNAIKSQPCSDCGGIFDPVCMDFDHRPGEVKIGNVSNLVSRAALDLVKAEIAKCDVVCANCHRLRTYRKRNHRAVAMRTRDRGVDPDAQLELSLIEGSE